MHAAGKYRAVQNGGDNACRFNFIPVDIYAKVILYTLKNAQ